MEKYLFTPSAAIMTANGKTQVNLDNFIANVMTTYGGVKPYIEPAAIMPIYDESVKFETAERCGESISIESGIESVPLAQFVAEKVRADKAEAELSEYAPLITAYKAMIAGLDKDDKAEIERLKTELTAFEKYKPLIDLINTIPKD